MALLGRRKLGQHEAAQALVDQIPRDLEMIENHTYYQSVLQGFRTEESLLPEVDSIIKFAIAMVHHFEGETDAARGNVARHRRRVGTRILAGGSRARLRRVEHRTLGRRRVAHDLWPLIGQAVDDRLGHDVRVQYPALRHPRSVSTRPRPSVASRFEWLFVPAGSIMTRHNQQSLAESLSPGGIP